MVSVASAAVRDAVPGAEWPVPGTPAMTAAPGRARSPARLPGDPVARSTPGPAPRRSRAGAGVRRRSRHAWNRWPAGWPRRLRLELARCRCAWDSRLTGVGPARRGLPGRRLRSGCRLLTRCGMQVPVRRPARGTGNLTIVDESGDTLRAQRVRVFVGVDGVIRHGIAPDRVQDATGIFRDHLNMAIKEDPVARQRFVTVAQRMPAMRRLRVLDHRGDTERCRVRVNADICPRVKLPRIGGTAGHPAVPANDMGRQLKGQTGERCAPCAVVRTVDAVVLPDQCLHLRRAPAGGHPEVVMSHIDDG